MSVCSVMDFAEESYNRELEADPIRSSVKFKGKKNCGRETSASKKHQLELIFLKWPQEQGSELSITFFYFHVSCHARFQRVLSHRDFLPAAVALHRIS